MGGKGKARAATARGGRQREDTGSDSERWERREDTGSDNERREAKGRHRQQQGEVAGVERWAAEGRHRQRQGEVGGLGKAQAATARGGRRREECRSYSSNTVRL